MNMCGLWNKSTAGAIIWLKVEVTILVSVSCGVSGDGFGMQQYGEKKEWEQTTSENKK